MQRLNTNPKRGFVRQSALNGRITALLKVFGDGKPHKAASLAQHIGVNSRTIRRTLHLMRDEMGIPLMAGRDGFLLENLEAIKQFITDEESTIAPQQSQTRFWTRFTTPVHG